MTYQDISGRVLAYHKDIGIPKPLQGGPKSDMALFPSRHTMQRMAQKGINVIPQTVADLGKFQLIEVSAIEATPITWVVRTRYGGGKDLVMVILSTGLIKTVYLNGNGDQHGTLDRDRYAHPDEFIWED
jgi:hypothetical protein